MKSDIFHWIELHIWLHWWQRIIHKLTLLEKSTDLKLFLCLQLLELIKSFKRLDRLKQKKKKRRMKMKKMTMMTRMKTRMAKVKREKVKKVTKKKRKKTKKKKEKTQWLSQMISLKVLKHLTDTSCTMINLERNLMKLKLIHSWNFWTLTHMFNGKMILFIITRLEPMFMKMKVKTLIHTSIWLPKLRENTWSVNKLWTSEEELKLK